MLNTQYYFNVYAVKVDQFWNYPGSQYSHQSINYVHMCTHTHILISQRLRLTPVIAVAQEIHIICNPASISIALCFVSNNLSGASTSCLL